MFFNDAHQPGFHPKYFQIIFYFFPELFFGIESLILQ